MSSITTERRSFARLQRARKCYTKKRSSVGGAKKVDLVELCLLGDKALLQAAIDTNKELLNQQDEMGHTPLHVTVFENAVDMASLLLLNGADANIQDSCGDTPLHWACFLNRQEIIKLFVELNTEINGVSGSDNKTPLEVAFERNHFLVCRYLNRKHMLTVKSKEGKKYTKSAKFQVSDASSKTSKGSKPSEKWVFLSEKHCELALTTSSDPNGIKMSILLEDIFEIDFKDDKLVFILRNGEKFTLFAEEGAATTKDWYETLRKITKPNMTVLKIQYCCKFYRTRQRFFYIIRKLRRDRDIAMRTLKDSVRCSEEQMEKVKDELAEANANGKALSVVTPWGIEGTLMKRDSSGSFRSWKKRYFVLDVRELSLRYYADFKSREDDNRKSHYAEFAIQDLENVFESSHDVEFGFEILHKSRALDIKAPNEKAFLDWIIQIQKRLPRRVIAALRIQSAFRMRQANKNVKKARSKKRRRELQDMASVLQQRRKKQKEEVEKLEKALADKESRFEAAKKKAIEAKNAKRAERIAKLRKLRKLKELKAKAKKIAATEAEMKAKKGGTPAWEEIVDPDTGNTYYHNTVTGESTWDMPEVLQWQKVYDEEHEKYYYFNKITGESTWEMPQVLKDLEGNNDEGESPEWREFFDEESGRTYYYNASTDTVTWENPATAKPVNAGDMELLSNFLQAVLADNSNVKEKILALSKSKDIFPYLDDGVLLSNLINHIEEHTIDARALNAGKDVEKIRENMTLVANAAKSIGCTLSPIMVSHLLREARDGTETTSSQYRNALRDLLEQLFTMAVLEDSWKKAVRDRVSKIMGNLMTEKEKVDDIFSMPKKELLLRWINASCSTTEESKVSTFGEGLEGARLLATVLLYVAADKCETFDLHTKLTELEDSNTEQVNSLAEALIGVLTSLEHDCPIDLGKTLTVKAMTTCSNGIFETLQGIVFVASDNLPDVELAEEAKVEMAEMMKAEMFYEELSHDDRVLTMWVNSIGADLPTGQGWHVNNIYSELADGVILLKIFNFVGNETFYTGAEQESKMFNFVKMKRVNFNCRNRYEKVENVNYVVELAKQLNFNLVNIGGLDILDKNRKITKSLLRQMMLYHLMHIMCRAKGGSVGKVKHLEKDVVTWANEKLSSQGVPGDLRNCGDKLLEDSVYLMDLLNAIRPGIVNWELVKGIETEEDKLHNARYVLSCGRKLGALIFLVPEDITKVNRKLLVPFFASLMACDAQEQNKK
eukprot:g1186.t1